MASLCRSKAKTFAVVSTLALVSYIGFQLMYLPVDMQICPDPTNTPHFYNSHGEEDDITVITMYLNIGTFTKRTFFFFNYESYASSQFKTWLFPWAKLHNKVVAFFDDDEFIQHFKKVRFHLPENYTTIIKITRDQLKAFNQLDRVKEVVSHPIFKTTYPPEYTCTMNAKYDALEMAFSRGLVKTKYAAWQDIGLWRRLEEKDSSFVMKIPPGFNSSKIGFSEVTPHEKFGNLSPLEIYQKNIVWVAGGFVLGTKQVLQKFLKAYRAASDELLQEGLADTDQQVIASMYSPAMIKNQEVEVETYACPRGSFGLFGYGYLYFCLPYICKASAECKHSVHVDQNNKVYSKL